MIPRLKSEGYSRDGIRLYPMDGGGSSSGGGGTQIQELPEWARPYAKNALEKGAALSETPYQAYNQPRIAGFSPMQQQAQQGAANMQTSGATGAGIGVAGTAAMRALNTNYQGGGYGNQFQAPGAYQPGQFSANQVQNQGLNNYQMGGPERVRSQNFGGQSAQDYMSPYMQNVVDVQQREAQRSADIAGTSRGAQAVRSGAFGGSRQAVMDAEAARNLATQKGDIQAQGQQAAFTNAQQQFNADQTRRMQAQQANQGAGLTAGQANLNALLGVQQLGSGQDMQAQLANQQYGLQAQQLGEQSRQFGAGQGLSAAQSAAQYGQAANQLNEQSNQYGAGLGMQGLQTALQGANTLGQLGGQQFQQGMDINKLQSAYGGQQQALRQQGLSQAYSDFQDEKNYPYKQLGFMSDMIRGLPLGQQTTKTMYEPGPNLAQNIGALGMGAYGLSKFMADGGMAYADGGEVEGYDEGGSVDSQYNVDRIVSKLSDQQLQQAMQAAQARGDQDQLEAIQSEMAMRASERNGLASAVTPDMANQMAAANGGLMDSYAGGGILAFQDRGVVDSSEESTEREQDYFPGNKKGYDLATQRYLESDAALAKFKPTPAMTKEDRAILEQEEFERRQKFAGEDPYASMTEKFKTFETDRAKNLEEGKGLAALQAIPAILQGRGIRGIGAGIGALGGNLAGVAKADAAEKRALASMDFNLKDAQRKERMGLTKDAMASVTNAQKDRIAADKAQLEALKARNTGAASAARAFRPTGSSGGANKGPKLPEQLAAAEIAYETNPTDANLKNVTALRRAVSLNKTSDFGPGRAGAAADAIAVKLKAAETAALEKLSRTPDYREATPAMKQAMEEKTRADVERRVNFEDAAPSKTPPPTGGKGKNDYSSLWTNPN